jgi:hypothetical protein
MLDRDEDICFAPDDGILCCMRRDGNRHDAIANLSGVDPIGPGNTRPVVFRLEGRHGLADLTGKTPGNEELPRPQPSANATGSPSAHSIPAARGTSFVSSISTTGKPRAATSLPTTWSRSRATGWSDPCHRPRA